MPRPRSSTTASTHPHRRENPKVRARATAAAVGAATSDDPVEGRLLYLREVARLRARAEVAQAWHATASLLRLERDLIDEIRTARLGAGAVLDEAALQAALVEAMRGLPAEQRRTVLTLVG